MTTITLAPGDQLVKRVEAFFAGIGVSFNKGSIANRLCADLNKMRSIDELRGTKDKAGALIAAINSALEW